MIPTLSGICYLLSTLTTGSRPTSASSMKNEPKDEKPAVAVATAPPAVDLEVTEPTPVVGGAEGKEADAAGEWFVAS